MFDIIKKIRNELNQLNVNFTLFNYYQLVIIIPNIIIIILYFNKYFVILIKYCTNALNKKHLLVITRFLFLIYKIYNLS